jgi:chorismate-pyruvate lyase
MAFDLLRELQGNSALTSFQKILLLTDGTVTELLALQTGQTIRATKLAHAIACADQLDKPAALICAPHAHLLRREIVLESNDARYIHAESYFVVDRFSPQLQKALADSDAPIGLLWKREKLEMFREVIDVQLLTAPEIAAKLGVPPASLLASRAYLLHHQREHLGIIRETFAVSQRFSAAD